MTTCIHCGSDKCIPGIVCPPILDRMPEIRGKVNTIIASSDDWERKAREKARQK